MSDGFQLRRRTITLAVRLGLLVALGCVLSAASFARSDSGRIHWKPVDGAILKLDGKPPLTWSVYQPDKKKQANLLLILLGHRYLVLNTKTKFVYGVVPTDLHADGKDFESDDLLASSKKIISKNWTMRDIGPAESIQLTLADYGGVLDIQLPHMPDLRPFY